jgi:hypothetical protein
MDRRDALERMAVAGSVALAGCGSDRFASGTVLGRVEVINASFVPNRIRLMIERPGETVLDRTIELSAIDAGDRGASALVEPSWSARQARYTVRAFHVGDDGDRESSGREYTFTRDDYTTYYGDDHEDPGCIAAVVRVGSRAEAEEGTIGIGPTYVETPCG